LGVKSPRNLQIKDLRRTVSFADLALAAKRHYTVGEILLDFRTRVVGTLALL
jgi:hypothetical protein